MPLSSYRGSTQDASAGVQVAVSVNEDDSSKALVAGTQVGNVTTWTEGSRTGITSADAPTGGDLTTGGFAGSAGANLIDKGNALNLAVRATCSVASASLTGRIVLYDASNNCIGITRSVSFTADATLRLGNATGDFVCSVDIVDSNQARKVRFFVDTVSSGTWAVYMRPV